MIQQENSVSENIKHITESDFDSEVLGADGPVLVDYWAEWCGPCKMIAPVLDELASEFEGKISITKVDVDTNAAIAQKYGIRGIPTLMIFKDGEVFDTRVGAATKGQLKEFIEKAV